MDAKSPQLELFGLQFDISTMIGTVVTCIIVFLITYLGARGMQMRKPTKRQLLVEQIVGFIRGMLHENMDRRTAEKYIGFSVTLFLFIFFANQLGVMMMVTGTMETDLPSLGLKAGEDVSWFKSPTANISIPIVMAVAITLFAHVMGIITRPKQYFKDYLNPMHIVGEITKPMTHAMRLWANIFAGEILIIVLVTVGSPLITGAPLIVWLGYSLFIGAVQAYVFTILASIYIAQKISPES